MADSGIGFGGGFVELIGLTLSLVYNHYRHIPLRVSRKTPFVTDPLELDGKSIDDLAKMLKGSFFGPTDWPWVFSGKAGPKYIK